MKVFLSPRLWIYIWGGVGLAVLAFILISASLPPKGSNSASLAQGNDASGVNCSVSALKRHPSFLTGELEDFAYAFTERYAPKAAFSYDGEQAALSDFQGKAVLVNFWATWCAPCLKELPSLDALQASKGDAHFEVVAVAADPTGPAAAATYLERLNIKNLKLYTDEKLQLASAVGGVSVLPVSVIYTAKGREVGRLTGEADWSAPEVERFIDNITACS